MPTQQASPIHIDGGKNYTGIMKYTSLRPLLSIKLLIFVSWAILFSLLLKRDVFIGTVNFQEAETLRQAESEEYQGIYFRDSKIGFVITRYQVGSDNETPD